MKTTCLLLPAITLLLMASSVHCATAKTLQMYNAIDYMRCDVNGDGVVDVADIATVISVMAESTEVSLTKADVNGDSTVDVADIATIITAMAEATGNEISYTSCPDDHHPHIIDLGLPSGTKWACCNVGASTPEEYGNYYAWGETSPKSMYDEYTYQYYNSNSSYINIGSDIAGTGYDAATANWGAPWRMPSLTQIQELLNNTTSTWTTQNGVNGRKFTGSNGGSVFLPAAGYRWGGELYFAGSDGYFWSSTLYESYPSRACSLYCYSGYANWNYYYRSSGQSVRPVR